MNFQSGYQNVLDMNFQFGYQNGFAFNFAVPFPGVLLPYPPFLAPPFPPPANVLSNNLPQLQAPPPPFIYPARIEPEQPAIDGTINPSLIFNTPERTASPTLTSVDGDYESFSSESFTPATSDASTLVVSPTGGNLSLLKSQAVQDAMLFDCAPTHQMPSKRAASKVAAKVTKNALGRFVCPVGGCDRDFGARCSLTRHLWSNGVACPQECDATVRRGNDKATMDRHLRLYCKKTPLETRLRNKAFNKKTTKAKSNAKKARKNTRAKSLKRAVETGEDDNGDYESPSAKRARTL